MNQTNEGKQIEAFIVEHLDLLNDKEAPLGKKTLAKMYLKRYSADYTYSEKEIDRVRSSIRLYLGRIGKKSIRSKRYDTIETDSGITQPSMPESECVERKPFIIPPGKLGVLSDIHVPYHEPHVIASAIKKFKDEGVNQILLNGDVMDFWKISRFAHIGKKRDTVGEIHKGREFFAWLRFQFPEIPIYFKMGNHDVRWSHYLWTKGPEIASLLLEEWGGTLGLGHFLRLPTLDIEILQDWQIIKAGKLNVLHGHEFGKSVFNPVNAARGAFMRGKSNVLVGHYHSTSEHQESNLEGDQIAAWSTGCLCELRPDYAPVNTKANWGAAIVEHFEDGRFFVDNFRILKGKEGYRIA